MLTARTAGTEHVHLNILRADLNIHTVIKFRNDLQGRKGRMAAAGGIKRRHTHQTMHARFPFQIAVGVLAVDLNTGTLEPRFVTVLVIQNFIGETAFFRPVGVHAVKHFRPILRLGSAGSGVKGKNSIVRIVFPDKQRCQALRFTFGFHVLHTGGTFFQKRQIALLIRQFNEGDRIVILGHQPFVPLDRVLQIGGTLRHRLRFLHIIPKPGLGGAHIQFADFFFHRRKADRLGQLFNLRQITFQPEPQFFKLQHILNPFSQVNAIIICHRGGKVKNFLKKG